MATVVFDADDTLWPGLILTDFPARLNPGVAECLKELHKRGHRIVCCSRNNGGRLIEVLDRMGLSPWVDEVAAGWEGKASLLAETKMQPGEPALFVDDEAFNRAEVHAVYPWITVLPPPADFLGLLEHPLLGPVGRAVTAEDMARVRLLREQRARDAAAPPETAAEAYRRFLDESKLVLTVYSTLAVFPDRTRALDLLNRTNELRTARRRYEKLPAPGEAWLVGAGLVDRFGDYGFIGVAVMEWTGKRAVALKDVAVSCRTMGRGVATSLVAWVAREVYGTGAKRLTGVVTPTDRNGPMRDLYRTLGFTLRSVTVSGGETFETWGRDLLLNALPTYAEWLTVKTVRP